ncbi:O-antigen ligase family protein [Devosia sp. WQ 349]|uniref:O-antigen ligase family protein n=1 Tax=Devosia sp. WQ 349K1 TaxID=2800329 RepID=UPI001903FABB|nr:O-antigen ligase family protein [Devosia sp. WQ 349K1]MBK1794162.1 O-antigen ligase family protein [Devosia sp. WQ 349K1]
MTDVLSASSAENLTSAQIRGRAYMSAVASKVFVAVVWIWVFSGGLVFFEPSLYEVLFLLTLGMMVAVRMPLFPSTLPLLGLIIPFTIFATIAAFQVRHAPLTDALIFNAVTIYLFLTSFFVANFIADAPEKRLAVIRNAYVAIAIVSAAIGILAYLRLMPNADMFLRYDRAKAMFKDPNVYGPFLVLPAMMVLRELFFQRKGQLVSGAIVLLIMLGVFVSFSRAAWGHFAASAFLVFVLCFLLEAKARIQVRMLTIAIIGSILVVVMLAGLLSVPEVREFFELRTMSQDYDTGESGRFGRQGYAFDLALDHPLGLGPTEFTYLEISEQPHNTYVTVLHGYGWGGGLIYYFLVALTFWRGLIGLRDPERRGLLIPVFAVFIPLALQSAIIDTDHWRHYFLVVGLIWGITAHSAPPGYSGLTRKRTQTSTA